MVDIFQISSIYLMTYGITLTGRTRTRSHAFAGRMDVVAAVDVAAVVTEVVEAAAVADTTRIEITIITMGAVDVVLVEAAMEEDMVETDAVAAMTIIMDEDVDNTPTMAMAMDVIIET